MANIRSKGGCKYCDIEYTKAAMIKHLADCKERKSRIEITESGEKISGYYNLSIESMYSNNYWLIVEIRADAKLSDLDQFLRDIWLECCGHLSSFKIDGSTYEADSGGASEWRIPAKTMSCKLESILYEGIKFEYIYDYGSSTELTIKVIGFRNGYDRKDKKKKIEVMARNKPLDKLCDVCGKETATVICMECAQDGAGLLCDKCAETHECDKDMFSNIVNSPRCGVCGYGGSEEYPDY